MQSWAPVSWVLGAVASEVLIAIACVLLLRRLQWRRRRIVLLSAVPLPGILFVLCIIVFVSAVTASKESCGVDACGMAAAGAIVLAVAATLLYLVGAAVGLATTYFLAKRNDGKLEGTFK